MREDEEVFDIAEEEVEVVEAESEQWEILTATLELLLRVEVDDDEELL